MNGRTCRLTDQIKSNIKHSFIATHLHINLQKNKNRVIHSFIHSFIHYGDLYSAPSILLLRSAPDPCTAEKKSFEARVECVRKNPGEQSLCQRKPIPHRGSNHRECTDLGCGGAIRLSIPADAMTMTTTTTTTTTMMMMRIFVYLFTAHTPDDIQSGLQSVMIINVYYIFPL